MLWQHVNVPHPAIARTTAAMEQHPILAARKAGIATMIGDVFATNAAMQGLGRKLGFAVAPQPG